MRYAAAFWFTTSSGQKQAFAESVPGKKGKSLPEGMLVIDAHAHPDQFYYLGAPGRIDRSSTLEQIGALGMNASSFAALGDESNFNFVLHQLDYVLRLESRGKVKVVRSFQDLPYDVEQERFVPGAILALESGHALDGPQTALDRLDAAYQKGVRMLTLIHKRDNQLGQSMDIHVYGDGTGLSGLGRQVVERMISLGMIIDVAHAHFATLKDITDIAIAHSVPVVDSHTSLIPAPARVPTRRRTWQEMEMVARTGGVICTWPLKVSTGAYKRTTIRDWAEENLATAKRIGNEHVGLGTDGGGLLPERVEGYDNILDLPKLIDAMSRAGFPRGEIDNYMGKNFFRVIKRILR
ncbi:MAG TPA: membrane dipeptidase [bacterium]|nr:membrane dipeptidase [bacterium]